MVGNRKTVLKALTSRTVLFLGSYDHAAIHTFPEKKDPFLSVCLYSCKSYDEENIIKYSNKYWDVKTNNIVIMHRHVGKPQELTQRTVKVPKLSLV